MSDYAGAEQLIGGLVDQRTEAAELRRVLEEIGEMTEHAEPMPA